MRKRRIAGSLALAFGLAVAGTAFAAQTTVPVSSLQPAIQLEKPRLTGVGGKLIFSDSPETFSSNGAFYRDKAEGEFRVFWHHQNAADHTLTVGVAVTNTSGERVRLSSKGSGLGTNIFVDVAGQSALTGFMRTQDQTQFLSTLSPGESYYVTAPTDSMMTNSGIVQFIASTENGSRSAQVTVTTLSYDVKPDHPEQAAILPADSLTRGTFPHFDRTGTIRYDTSMGSAYLSVDSDAVGPWSGNAMPGEYEEGWDAADGKTVINNGNYGVMYRLTAEIVNSYHHPRSASLYLNPAGGYGHYTVKWNKEIYQSDYLSYEDAWQIAGFKLGPNGETYSSEMSLTGGSSGPQVIYFANQPK